MPPWEPRTILPTEGGISRRAVLGGAGMTLAAAALAGVPAAAAADAAGDPISGLLWPSGLGNAADEIEAFERWRKAPCGVFAGWTNIQKAAQTWDDFMGGPKGRYEELGALFSKLGAYNINKAAQVLPKQVPLVWIFPLLPQEAGNSGKGGQWKNPGIWRRLTDPNGDLALWKDVWFNIGARLVVWLDQHGRAYDTLTMDIGWELTGNWYPWSIGPDVDGFKPAWRTAIDSLRAGLRHMSAKAEHAVKIGWRVAGSRITDNQHHIDRVYPGDAWVDVIGRSLHEGPKGQWGRAEGWKRELDGDGGRLDGLEMVLAFARSQGKKFGVFEWNLAWKQGDPAFPPSEDPAGAMANIFAFFRANATEIAGECYLHNRNTRLIDNQDNWAGAAEYLRQIALSKRSA
ncbi:hypothetical protein [Benzoatithermus flavus]|uniref:GH26 domain-containing protein n=1 Tax=Benzoatithermus flavus TaxID=3108223 RepID=A0ABU8XQ32_9PROT